MGSGYYERLLAKVLEASMGNTWEDAVQEWEISDWSEDETNSTSCICGKEDIRYLFTIQNKNNKKILEPIGSSCIKKFDRQDLASQTNLFEQLFKLQAALSKNNFIGLTSDYFSRRLLKYLYEESVLDSDYNKFNGQKDYEFLLKMFNKKDKSKITDKQQSKINAIIIKQIIPYLRRKL